MRAAVLTISSSRTRREDDESGNALVAFCEEAGLETVYDSVSDDREEIATALKRLADNEQVRFIFTTGGTGLTHDDVTPE
ncbi:MAG TPA: molybdopterin-binding protein, partial [Thermoleophilaceae bacterium]